MCIRAEVDSLWNIWILGIMRLDRSCVWLEQFPTILSGERVNQPRVINVPFNLICSVFGGGYEKYWPLKKPSMVWLLNFNWRIQPTV